MSSSCCHEAEHDKPNQQRCLGGEYQVKVVLEPITQYCQLPFQKKTGLGAVGPVRRVVPIGQSALDGSGKFVNRRSVEYFAYRVGVVAGGRSQIHKVSIWAGAVNIQKVVEPGAVAEHESAFGLGKGCDPRR